MRGILSLYPCSRLAHRAWSDIPDPNLPNPIVHRLLCPVHPNVFSPFHTRWSAKADTSHSVWSTHAPDWECLIHPKDSNFRFRSWGTSHYAKCPKRTFDVQRQQAMKVLLASSLEVCADAISLQLHPPGDVKIQCFSNEHMSKSALKGSWRPSTTNF